MMSIKNISRNKGFTFTELLVYIAVLAIILLALTSFFYWAVRSKNKAKVMRENYDSARQVRERITREVKKARSIYTPTTSSTQLSLETVVDLPEGEQTTYTDFFLCGARVCMKREFEEPLVISGDNVEISNLVFEIVGTDPSSVRFSFDSSYLNPQNKPEYRSSTSLTTTVSLRSY